MHDKALHLTIIIGILLVCVSSISSAVSYDNESKLRISDIDVYIEHYKDPNEKSDKNKNEDDNVIDEEVRPLSTVKFDIRVDNRFTDEQDIDIEDVEVSIMIKDIDDHDDLEKSLDMFDLRADKYKRMELEFEIPLKVEEGIYDVVITAEGEDEKGYTHEHTMTLYLEVDKEDHKVIIDKATLLPEEVSCKANFTNLVLSVTNIGDRNEDETVILITSSELNLNIYEMIELDEDPDDDENDYEKTYMISIPKGILPGKYPIDIKVYYDTDELSDQITKYLTIKECINNPPTITSTPLTTVRTGQEYRYDVNAEDIDGDTLTYSLTTNPDGMSIDSNGLITWTPTTEGGYDVAVSVTDGYNITTQSFTVEVSSNKLVIKNVKVYVDDKKDVVDNGDKINKEAKPRSDIEFEIEIENLFQENIEIEDIDVKVTIKDIDDGDDLEDDDSINSLDNGDEETVTLNFDIPLEVEDGDYDVLIEVDGMDENNNKHEDDWVLELEIDKEQHKVIINDIRLVPSVIRCDSSTSIEVEVINIGSKDEDDVTIEIINHDLGLNMRETEIELEEGVDDNRYRFSAHVNIDPDIDHGTYPIMINVYLDSELETTDKANLIIESCEKEVVKTVKEVEAAPEVELITTQEPVFTKQMVEKEPVTTNIIYDDTDGYLTLLIIGNIILLGIILYALVAVIIQFSKRK